MASSRRGQPYSSASARAIQRESRSWYLNKQAALARLKEKLEADARDAATSARAQERREQVGSGMRGDKRRTIRAQDNTVVDHLTGRTWRLRDYLRGAW